MNLPSNINITKETNAYVLKDILTIYRYTIKDTLFNLGGGGEIVEFTDIKKRAVLEDIVWRWGHRIVGEYSFWIRKFGRGWGVKI